MSKEYTLKVDTNHVHLSIDLHDKIVLIMGDSGTGKTYIFNMLRRYELGGNASIVKSNIPNKNIVTIKSKEDAHYKLVTCNRCTDDIIIFDKTEDYFDSKLVDWINKHPNRCIIMARGFKTNGIKARLESAKELEMEKIGEHTYLKTVDT